MFHNTKHPSRGRVVDKSPFLIKKSVFLNRPFAPEMPHKGLKWPKTPCLRNHIPCPALILDAPMNTLKIEDYCGSIQPFQLVLGDQKQGIITVKECWYYFKADFHFSGTTPYLDIVHLCNNKDLYAAASAYTVCSVERNLNIYI